MPSSATLASSAFSRAFEVSQVVAKPDAAHPAGRHEHATLAQFVTDADLAMGRVFDGVGDNRCFRFKIDPVLRVGNPARPLQQRLDTAFLDRVADAARLAEKRGRLLLSFRGTLTCPFHLFHRASQRRLGSPARTSF